MSLYHSKIYGIVQGVGFRPFVSRLAAKFGIRGSVANKGPYVEIFAQRARRHARARQVILQATPPNSTLKET